MKKDIRIIPDTDGLVEFYIRGGDNDSAVMLLQRLYTLMLSDPSSGYRGGSAEATLVDFLNGANIPEVDALNSRLALVCASVLDLLSEEDRELIASFTGLGDEEGNMTFTLILNDGTEASGTLNYV